MSDSVQLVSDLVKQGKTTKQIAELSMLSLRRVQEICKQLRDAAAPKPEFRPHAKGLANGDVVFYETPIVTHFISKEAVREWL